MSALETCQTLCQMHSWAHAISAAWRPLLDPLPVDTYWLWLMLPMVAAIAVVYKALKVSELSEIPSQALVLAAQLVFLMVVAGATLWLINALV